MAQPCPCRSPTIWNLDESKVLSLAWQFWEEGRLDEVAKEIEGYRPGRGGDDPRGSEVVRDFAWYYQWRLAHPPRRLIRDSQPLYGLAFSPDGTLLAGGSKDERVRLGGRAHGRRRRCPKPRAAPASILSLLRRMAAIWRPAMATVP